MFTENPYKGVIKCDCCNFQQQVVCNPGGAPIKYNFHQVEVYPIVQPMVENTKDKPFIKGAEGSIRLQLCDTCYEKIQKALQDVLSQQQTKYSHPQGMMGV